MDFVYQYGASKGNMDEVSQHENVIVDRVPSIRSSWTKRLEILPQAIVASSKVPKTSSKKSDFDYEDCKVEVYSVRPSITGQLLVKRDTYMGYDRSVSNSSLASLASMSDTCTSLGRTISNSSLVSIASTLFEETGKKAEIAEVCETTKLHGSFVISDSLLRPPSWSFALMMKATLVLMSIGLSFFVTYSRSFRREALYLPEWIPVMATTSLSPFLILGTPRMMKSRRTSILCLFEWGHCLMAMFHHLYKHPACVVVAGIIFPLWSIWMQILKEHDYCSVSRNGQRESCENLKAMSISANASKVDSVALASLVIYAVFWFNFGEIYVLGGAGPMMVLAPFVRHEMYVSDMCIFGMLGFLFVAENLVHIFGMMFSAQVLHVVSHFALSYSFHSINTNHFFCD